MKRNIKTQQGSLCLFFVSKVLPVIKDSFKTVITIFIIIFTLSFGTSCKQRMNIKEFIERELAKDRSNTIVLYDTSATGYNNTVYVPSENDITGTVNIKNEYNVGYTAVLTLDAPSQSAYFAAGKAPKITLSENDKFQFKFTFKKEADGNASSKGAEVPVTVKLIKKEGGALFAEKHFTIRCNTPPAPLQVSSSGDSFTLKRDADSIYHDISLVTCTCTLATNGKSFDKSFFSRDFASGETSFIVKKLLKTPPNNVLLYNASGKRTLTGFVTDTVGLRSKEFSCEGDYRYGTGATLSGCKLDGVSVEFNSTDLKAEKEVSGNEATFTIGDISPEATLSCTGGTYDSANKKISISAISETGKTVTITVKSEDEKTTNIYTLIVKKNATVVLDANALAGDAWKKLKELVENGNAKKIIVKGNVIAQSTSSPIAVNRTVSIEGETATINGNDICFIFSINMNGDLTLKNLTLEKGKLKNTGTNPSGGGAVYCSNGSTLQMDTVTIKDCTSEKNGGAIYCNGGTVTLTTTTIDNCSADSTRNGGGVYISDGTVTMINGSISGCSAKKGGGVYIAESGKFTMKGSAKVSVDNNKNDVYLVKENTALNIEQRTIRLDGPLSSSIVARITPQEYTAGKKLLSGDIASNDNYKKFKVTAKNPADKWIISNDGSLQLEEATITGADAMAWKKLKETIKKIKENGTIVIDGTVKATNEAENKDAISISKSLTIKGINRGTLDAAKDSGNTHRIFEVTNGTLTLEDITLSGAKNTAPNDNFNAHGAAIFLDSKGELIMKNAIIENCETTKGCGGAIASRGTRITMEGSSQIKTCMAQEGGGAIFLTANNVNNNTGSLYMKDSSKISGCKTQNSGGGVKVYAGAMMSMSDSSEVSGCTAGDKGGGVYISYNKAKLEKSGGSVKNNTARNGSQAYVEVGGILNGRSASSPIEKNQPF